MKAERIRGRGKRRVLRLSGEAEATVEYQGRGWFYEYVRVNGVTVAKGWSLVGYVPVFDFGIPGRDGPERARLLVLRGPLGGIRGLRLSVGGETVYEEGRFPTLEDVARSSARRWRNILAVPASLVALLALIWLVWFGLGSARLALAERAWEREIGPVPGPPSISFPWEGDWGNRSARDVQEMVDEAARGKYGAVRQADRYAREERARASAIPGPTPEGVLDPGGHLLFDYGPVVRYVLDHEPPRWEGPATVQASKTGGALVSDGFVRLSRGQETEAGRSLEAAWKIASIEPAEDDLLATRVKAQVQRWVMGALRKMEEPGPDWIDRLGTAATHQEFVDGLCEELGGSHLFFAEDRVWEKGRRVVWRGMGVEAPLVSRIPPLLTKPWRLTHAAGMLERARIRCLAVRQWDPCLPLPMNQGPAGEPRDYPFVHPDARRVMSILQNRFSRFLLDAEFTRKFLRLQALRSETGAWPEEPDWFSDSRCPNVTWHYEQYEGGGDMTMWAEVEPPRTQLSSLELPLRITTLPEFE